MRWLNPPPAWSLEAGVLRVTTGASTDFWRATHYGFIRDNGHFHHRRIGGDFELSVEVRGAFRTLYDQAGLMVRLDAETWVKTGIEFVDRVQQASAVVTRGFSDWSVSPIPNPPAGVRFRLHRRREALTIEYALEGAGYQLLRLAYFPPDVEVDAGFMCASPDGEGFDLELNRMVLRPLPAGTQPVP